MTKLDIRKLVDEAIKALSDNYISKPFTIYIDESQYSKKVIDKMKKTYCYNVVIKFIRDGKVTKSIPI